MKCQLTKGHQTACDLVITKIVREIFVRSSSFCRTLGEHVVYKNCSERQNFFFAHTAYR